MPRPDGSWRRWLMMNRWHAVAICSILQLFCSRKMFSELSFCILAWKASVNVLLIRMCPRQVEKIWLCPPFLFRWVFCTLRSGLHVISVSPIRYDTRCYFNVRSKADISQLNLPHGTDNWKSVKTEKKLNSKKTDMLRSSSKQPGKSI